MNKWMIILRESDAVHFLWNGEGCVRVSPLRTEMHTQTEPIPRWHHDYGQLPQDEIAVLNHKMLSAGHRSFTLPDHGRYKIVARGEFQEL